MTEVTIAVSGGHADQVTRDLVGLARRIDGASPKLVFAAAGEGSRASAGELLGAVVNIVAENAIGPLIELLRAVVVRERKTKLSIKLPDNTVFELDSANVAVDIDRLSASLLSFAERSRK